GHLVGARDKHLLGGDDRLDERIDRAPRDLARGLLDVEVIRGERGLELVLIEREQWRGAPGGARWHGLALHAAGFLPRRRLQLRKPLEAERLGEAHHRGARSVGSAGELLGGLEGGLVEVVDDVLGDVLLRAGAVLVACADVFGQALVLARAAARGPAGRRALGGGSDESLHRRPVSTGPPDTPARALRAPGGASARRASAIPLRRPAGGAAPAA